MLQTPFRPSWILKVLALALLLQAGELVAAAGGAKLDPGAQALKRELKALYDRGALARKGAPRPEADFKRIQASPKAWVAGVTAISAPGSAEPGLEKYYEFWLRGQAKEGDPSGFLRKVWPAIQASGERRVLLNALPALSISMDRIHFGRGFGAADKERREQILKWARAESRQLQPSSERYEFLHFCLRHDADPDRLLEDAQTHRGHSELDVLMANQNLFGARRAMDALIESDLDPMAAPRLAFLLKLACQSGRLSSDQAERARTRLSRMLPDLAPKLRREIQESMEKEAGAPGPRKTP